jgi:large subunit ribosomal protein L35
MGITMKKVKTKSSAKKRFFKTGGKNIKIKRSKAFRRHLLTKKGPKKRRMLRAATYFNATDQRAILKLLPY